MIPQTFPSVVDANNRTKMVVYEVPSIVGLTRWVDYIPVKSPVSESDLSLANTYANNGFILSNSLTSVTGLQAFKDYIPIYVDNAATVAWTTDANGYIPLSDLFSIPSLFANGEQGVWYDPSDFTTMFQDSAGTTPVTAVEQPVGRILDKSGRGNHATQSTGTKRPVLSARYNLLIRTEEFNNASWTKDGINAFGSGSVANTTATTDPLGGNTADFIQESIGTGQHRVFQSVVTGIKGVRSFYVKSNGNSRFFFIEDLGASAWFNIDNGTLGTVGAGGTATITAIGTNGWYRCTLEGGSTGSQFSICGLSNADNVKSYTGDGTSGIFIWGAQLVPNNQSTIPYQQVTTSTNYDTDPTNFPPYLKFDGIDDALFTSSINFTDTDKMSAWVGIRNINTVTATLVELTNSFTSTKGFGISCPSTGGSNTIRAYLNNVTLTSTPITGLPPNTFVANFSYNNNAVGSIASRINATPFLPISTGTGGGNFVNDILYIGARAGTTAGTYFKGDLYSLILRGAESTATQITNTETYVNSKTKAY